MNPETIPENPQQAESEEQRYEEERRKQIPELQSRIEGALRDAAYDKLEGSRIEQIVLQDRAGNAFVYTLSQEEAEEVERALWSAGESEYLERFREGVAAQALERGLTLANGDDCSITVRRAAAVKPETGSTQANDERHAA